ncbi:MAG: hypothetical protein ISS01_01270 [Nanoarchaeota archaeon]|nr:hypothetical protein [Nanoarchaeota archaeon]
MIPDSNFLRSSLLVRREIGEFAYTAGQISEMFIYAFEGTAISTPNSDQIRDYVINNQLFISSEELGIKGNSRIKYWIPKSCFGDIIQGLDLLVSVSDLENALVNLGYQC